MVRLREVASPLAVFFFGLGGFRLAMARGIDFDGSVRQKKTDAELTKIVHFDNLLDNLPYRFGEFRKKGIENDEKRVLSVFFAAICHKIHQKRAFSCPF